MIRNEIGEDRKSGIGFGVHLSPLSAFPPHLYFQIVLPVIKILFGVYICFILLPYKGQKLP